MARRDYHALLYITLLRNYTAVTNLFLLLSIRKKTSEKIKEKKMKQKNVCKIEENLDHLLYLKANFIIF